MSKIRYFHAHETARYDEVNGCPLAGFRPRMWAILIDLLIIEILKLIFHVHGKQHNEAPVGTFSWWILEAVDRVEELVESAFYFAIALKLGKGQTPGKRLMKIKVVSLTNHEIGWWQSIERALGYGASLLEGGFGFVQFWLNRNRMCVHDRIAETIVVDVRMRKNEAAADAADASDTAESLN